MRLNQQMKDNLSAALTIGLLVGAVALVPEEHLRFIAGLLLIVVASALALAISVAKVQADDIGELRALLDAGPAVDPWAMMRALMEISDQQRPDRPALTKASLMYSALIMEEASETFRDGLAPCLGRFITSYATSVPGVTNPERGQRIHTLRVIHARLSDAAGRLETDSKVIRTLLESIPDFAFPMLLSEAVPTFDGTTDLAVVNCGFSISCGLPGADGYLEVAGSNLSKKNPDTGVIDKTADGKWIKGRNYREPDLVRVLAEAREENDRVDAV